MGDLRLVPTVPPKQSEGDEYDGQRCEHCGGAWFFGRVCVGPDSSVTGYTLPLTCGPCGREFWPRSEQP